MCFVAAIAIPNSKEDTAEATIIAIGDYPTDSRVVIRALMQVVFGLSDDKTHGSTS
jgi:hypothetical protein